MMTEIKLAFVSSKWTGIFGSVRNANGKRWHRKVKRKKKKHVLLKDKNRSVFRQYSFVRNNREDKIAQKKTTDGPLRIFSIVFVHYNIIIIIIILKCSAMFIANAA